MSKSIEMMSLAELVDSTHEKLTPAEEMPFAEILGDTPYVDPGLAALEHSASNDEVTYGAARRLANLAKSESLHHENEDVYRIRQALGEIYGGDNEVWKRNVDIVLRRHELSEAVPTLREIGSEHGVSAARVLGMAREGAYRVRATMLKNTVQKKKSQL